MINYTYWKDNSHKILHILNTNLSKFYYFRLGHSWTTANIVYIKQTVALFTLKYKRKRDVTLRFVRYSHNFPNRL